MFEIGDWVKVVRGPAHNIVGDFVGPIIWIQPSGANRVSIQGTGYLFRPENVELLWIDIDVSEFD